MEDVFNFPFDNTDISHCEEYCGPNTSFTLDANFLPANLNSDLCSIVNSKTDDDIDNSNSFDLNPVLKESNYYTIDEFNANLRIDDNFLLVQLNCRSLAANFVKLKLFLSALKRRPDAIALSETWIKEDVSHLYNIPDYNFLTIPRSSGRGGGVGIYLLASYAYTIRNDILLLKDNSCEFIPIKITTKKVSTLS